MTQASNEVQEFGGHMIEAYLQAKDLHYYQSCVGEYLVLFEARTTIDTASRVQIVSEGPDGSILTVRIRTDRMFEPEQHAQLQAVCDRWNGEHRWPKAFVHVHASGSLELVAEEHLATREAGIHQQMVDKFCEVVTAGGFEFWEWVREQDTAPLAFQLSDTDLTRLLGSDDQP